MFGLIFVAATVIQAISSQGPPPPFPPHVPEQCRRPPQDGGKPHECCKIPPFFSEDDFKECGFEKVGEGEPQRPGPPDCSKQLCILKKYDLLKDENSVDHEKVLAFMDKWGESNADFKPAVEAAKANCVGKPLPGPPFICEANKLVFCIKTIMFGECPSLPVWVDTDGCTKLKEHMNECSPYFAPPKE